MVYGLAQPLVYVVYDMDSYRTELLISIPQDQKELSRQQ